MAGSVKEIWHGLYHESSKVSRMLHWWMSKTIMFVKTWSHCAHCNAPHWMTLTQHADVFPVEISTELCLCWNGKCTRKWIFDQLMIMKSYFNFLNTLPGGSESVCSIRIHLEKCCSLRFGICSMQSFNFNLLALFLIPLVKFIYRYCQLKTPFFISLR